MKAIETIECTWEKFVEANPISNIEDKKYIYRGQTNGEITNKNGEIEFTEWPIISSFNRYIKPDKYDFKTFLFQQVDAISWKYNDYKIVQEREIADENIISQAYFLQHYGVPTCFIDFTFHPFIALYFSISNLNMQSGGTSDSEGFPNEYPERYFTIHKIDIKGLLDILKIKTLINSNLNIWNDYENYKINIDEDNFGNFAIDLDPLSKIKRPESNYNIRKQHSCFLLFDNSGIENHLKGIGLEDFLVKYTENNHIEPQQPIIYKYRIKYDTAYKPSHKHRHTIKPLFTFLKEQQVIGYNLFDDIQGLKYDFNFFHQEY